MTHHRLPKAKGLVSISLLLVLGLAVACGAAATPTPAAKAPPAAAPKPTVEVLRHATPTPLPAPTTAPAPVAAPQPTPVPTATPKPAATPAVMQPKYGGIIPMHSYAATDPRMVHEWGFPLMQTASALFSNLIEYNPETREGEDLRGDLARSWELAKDGVTYTFRLHENARWHDGTPVTSEDVVFSLTSMLNPNSIPILKGRITSATIQIGQYVESYRAIDPLTVEIKTKFPTGSFLSALAIDALKMIPKHVVVDQGKVQSFKKPEELMGSGPFKLTKWTRDVSNELEKNKDYFKKGYPRIDGIKHFIIVDKGTTIAAFKTGQVLMGNGPVNNLTSLEVLKLQEEMKGKLTAHFGGPMSSDVVAFNVTRKPFDDVRVRRAISLAIHRQPIIQINSGGIDLLGTPLPPGVWFGPTLEEAAQQPGYRELDGKKHPDDIAMAKKLLAEAGYPDGAGFQATLMARNCCAYAENAQLIKDQLKRFLNLDITVKAMESVAGFAAFDAGEHQFMYQASGHNFMDPDAVLARYIAPGTHSRWAGGGKVGAEKVVPGVQELFEQQKKELDPIKRKAIVRQIEDILVNVDTYQTTIFWFMRNWIVANKIQNFNVPTSVASSPLKHEHLWCDPPC